MRVIELLRNYCAIIASLPATPFIRVTWVATPFRQVAPQNLRRTKRKYSKNISSGKEFPFKSGNKLLRTFFWRLYRKGVAIHAYLISLRPQYPSFARDRKECAPESQKESEKSPCLLGKGQGKLPNLDGPNRQSLVFSERGQLSQAIQQVHMERILHQRTPIARFESQRTANAGSTRRKFCVFRGRYDRQRMLVIRIAAIILASDSAITLARFRPPELPKKTRIFQFLPNP